MSLLVRASRQRDSQFPSFILLCPLYMVTAEDVIQIKSGSSHPKRSGLKVGLSTLNDLIKQQSVTSVPSHLGFD